MGFRYLYYDDNGNGPFAIETDTVEEARQLVASGIGYDKGGQPYDQDKPDDVIVDTEKGDTVGDGPTPDGVLLPDDAGFQGDAPEQDATQLPSQVGSQDVAGANAVGVQDPSVAAHDVAGSPVTPVPTTPNANPSATAATPAYQATVEGTGVTPSGPTPPPSDSASADGGPSSDGSPSPAPASPASSPATPDADSSDGPVVPGDTPVPPLGAPVDAGATDSLPPTSEAAQADASDASDGQLEDDGDDDLSSFDGPVVPAPGDDATTAPAVSPTA